MVSDEEPSMNPWEVQALKYGFPEQTGVDANGAPVASSTWRQVQDPVIYPGLYSASGLDVMDILLQVMSRPNPKINLGPIDASVALVVCDLNLPDSPIVYVSDAFCELTGYSSSEIMGQNCRFLQTTSNSLARSTGSHSRTSNGPDKLTVNRLSQAVHRREEIQLRITNYKKTGQPFTNILSIIPLPQDSSGHCYAVGLQVEA